jgi:hypothetical protein
MIGRRAFIILVLAMASGLPTAGAAAARPGYDQEPPDHVVRRLYRDFAWEAVFSDPEVNQRWVVLIDQPEPVLRRYFTPKLARLLVDDVRCAEAAKAICRLDFSPIWASQESGAHDVTVSPTTGGIVDVGMSYGGEGVRTRLRYSLVRTTSGWRISDIVSLNDGWSLNKLLTEK